MTPSVIGQSAPLRHFHRSIPGKDGEFRLLEREHVGAIGSIAWAGTIIAVHTEDSLHKGHVDHASKEDPQCEIKSDKADHVAAHKGSALEHAR